MGWQYTPTVQMNFDAIHVKKKKNKIESFTKSVSLHEMETN